MLRYFSMKERTLSHIRYNYIKLAIYFTLAVLIFIFRDHLIEHLKYFIGGLMIMYALEEVLFELLFHRHHFFHQSKVYLGFIELLLGLILVIVNVSYEGTCIIWATWSLLRETHEVEEILAELNNLPAKILSGVESLVIIVFSVMLIIEPTEHHAMIHLYLLLVELIVAPLTPLLDETMTQSKKKRNQQNESKD